MSTHYDVAIIGGGIVGHTLQIACSVLGLSTCLIDEKQPVFSASQDGRAIALAYTSVTLLKNLGVWAQLASQATPIERVKVSSKGRLGTLVCDARTLAIPYLGQVIPAPLLGAAVANTICPAYQHPSSRIIDSVIALQSSPEHATIALTQQTLTSSLVLACDGTQSFCREYLQMETLKKNSDKKALVVNARLDSSHCNTAFQRLITGGVCALLPLSENKVTVVWSLEASHADSLYILSDDALSAALKEIWNGRFGAMSIEGPRFIYPLTQLYVKHPIVSRVILMGNAAHTLNPIAAQGLNLAFRDIAVLYDLLADAKALSADFGIFVPDRYLSRIQSAHQRMEHITDFMVNMVYAKPIEPLQGMGLSLMQHLPFVKRKWAAVFAGLDGQAGQLLNN